MLKTSFTFFLQTIRMMWIRQNNLDPGPQQGLFSTPSALSITLISFKATETDEEMWWRTNLGPGGAQVEDMSPGLNIGPETWQKQWNISIVVQLLKSRPKTGLERKKLISFQHFFAKFLANFASWIRIQKVFHNAITGLRNRLRPTRAAPQRLLQRIFILYSTVPRRHQCFCPINLWLLIPTNKQNGA